LADETEPELTTVLKSRVSDARPSTSR